MRKEILVLFGRRVRARRIELGLSQEVLAANCGLDRTYISMVERGVRNPSLLNIEKLAHGLDSTVSELLQDCDTEPSD
jgi:transcriptional regulator with XRE-family HTH domain